jgi:argininosuccinate lyase
MKLWQKDTNSHSTVHAFTAGKDRAMDAYLAPHDAIGSLAHIQMLNRIGLLSDTELSSLQASLRKIYLQTREAGFTLSDNVEDIHSQVEWLLTQELGDMGKKIHAARSRNDQVLLDIRLFLRAELEQLVSQMDACFALLQKRSTQHKQDLLPGYTHLQLAMPSSFGLWFGAYAESLVDDLITIEAAYRVVNKNPLGSAAGYGSSFPIDRSYTTELLGFDALNHNVVYAQMGRGRVERIVAQAISNVADTLGRLSMDVCLYLNPQFGFLSFPDELTTGSSIMPHKKNPDVFELIRARCNRIKALANEIQLITANLPSGYHRDLQLLKENLFPAFRELGDCLEMATYLLEQATIKSDLLKDPKYDHLFSVEMVNQLVLQGVPFRDAYRQVGRSIEAGTYQPDRNLNHTHEGSIGNLCNEAIAVAYQQIRGSFPFERVKKALDQLVGGS